jgi:hypothetical protein
VADLPRSASESVLVVNECFVVDGQLESKRLTGEKNSHDFHKVKREDLDFDR